MAGSSDRSLPGPGNNLTDVAAQAIPIGVVAAPGALSKAYDLRIEDINEWDGYADGWDEEAATRAYAEAAFASLRGLLSDRGATLLGANVIDFGCGTGLLTEQLVAAGASVDAVDTSSAMLTVLDSKVAQHGWSNVRSSAELPGAASGYDLIVCSSVCSFLDDYPRTVRDLVSCLRPGGIFVQWDWERSGDDPDGLSYDEITETLDLAGLDEVSVSAGFTASAGGQTMSPLMGHGRRPQAGA